MAAKEYTTLGVDGRKLHRSSPSKVCLPAHDGRPAVTQRGPAGHDLGVAQETIVAGQPREPRRAALQAQDGRQAAMTFATADPASGGARS